MKLESSDMKSSNSSRGFGAPPEPPLSPSSTIRPLLLPDRESVISRTAQMGEQTMISAAAPAEFRQPAEWAPHDACWLAWPSAADLWLGNLNRAQAAFVELCAAISDVDPKSGEPRGERLEVLVPTPQCAKQAEGA